MSNDSPVITKNPTYERWRYQIFAITWLSYVGFYFTRKAFSIAKIPMQDSLNITKDQMAYIDQGYLIAYAIGQFVWGMAGDKVGTRRIITIGMFFSVVVSIMMGLSTTVQMLGVFFLLQGVCQSTGWAPLNKNMSEFFSQRERGVAMGWWCTNYAVGGLLASLFAGFIAENYVEDYGIKIIFIAPAAVLFVIWLLFLFLQKDKPQDLGLPPIEEYHHENIPVIDAEDSPEEEVEGKWETIRDVLCSPMVWLLSGIYFLLKPARYAILFWGPLYISERLGTDIKDSSIISAMFELAGPLSVLAAGYLSDKIFRSKRMPVCVIGLFFLSAVLFSLHHLPSTQWTYIVALFLIGLFLYGPDALISGTAAVDFGTRKGASTATGLVNGFGSIGAIIGGTIPGYLNERWGWSGVFNFLGGMVLLAAILLLPQWNRLPVSKAPKTE